MLLVRSLEQLNLWHLVPPREEKSLVILVDKEIQPLIFQMSGVQKRPSAVAPPTDERRIVLNIWSRRPANMHPDPDDRTEV